MQPVCNMLIVCFFCIYKARPICCSGCSASQEIRVTRLRKGQQTLLRVASAGLVYWVARFFLLGTKAWILGLTKLIQYCKATTPVLKNTKLRSLLFDFSTQLLPPRYCSAQLAGSRTHIILVNTLDLDTHYFSLLIIHASFT